MIYQIYDIIDYRIDYFNSRYENKNTYFVINAHVQIQIHSMTFKILISYDDLVHSIEMYMKYPLRVLSCIVTLYLVIDLIFRYETVYHSCTGMVTFYMLA